MLKQFAVINPIAPYFINHKHNIKYILVEPKIKNLKFLNYSFFNVL